MTLGEKIQHYRKRDGLSQEELARLLVVSRQTVSLWETGQTYPTIDNLIRLREIFRVSIDELLTGEETDVEASNTDAPKTDGIKETVSASNQTQKNAVKIVSVILFVLSIATAAWNLLLRVAVMYIIGAPVISTSLLSVLLSILAFPIPMASVIFGFCIRARGYGGKKNIIAGFLAIGISLLLTLLLLLAQFPIYRAVTLYGTGEVVYDAVTSVFPH